MSGVTDITYRPWMDSESPATTGSKVCLFDVIRGMSIMNSKNYEYTDRKGNLQGVLCDIIITSNVASNGQVTALPNSWKLRNATRKFHFLREAMFRRAGVTKSERGKYGHTMRPYFDKCHYNDQSLSTGQSYWENNPVIVSGKCPPDAGDTYAYNYAVGGDWTRTELVSADSDHSALAFPVVIDSADTWSIYFADTNVSNAPPWSAVGMIHSYNLDRMEVVTPELGETLSPNNPLALLKSQTVTGGEVTEIAEELELEEPPYDIDDAGDSVQKISIGDFRLSASAASSSTGTGECVIKNVFLPAGYCALDFPGLLFPGSGDGSFLKVRFDVHAIVDCKDWIEA